MSSNAIEKALWEIGTDPFRAGEFRNDPTEFVDRFQLDSKERHSLLQMDVADMARRDVNTMLLFRAFRAVYGPQSVPEYMARMNEQSTGRS